MFTAALPAHLAPTHIVCKDINNVRFLAELFFKCRQVRIDLLVLGGPFVLVFLLQLIVGGVELLGESGAC